MYRFVHFSNFAASSVGCCQFGVIWLPLIGMSISFEVGRDVPKVAGESSYCGIVNVLFLFQSSRESNSEFLRKSHLRPLMASLPYKWCKMKATHTSTLLNSLLPYFPFSFSCSTTECWYRLLNFLWRWDIRIWMFNTLRSIKFLLECYFADWRCCDGHILRELIDWLIDWFLFPNLEMTEHLNQFLKENAYSLEATGSDKWKSYLCFLPCWRKNLFLQESITSGWKGVKRLNLQKLDSANIPCYTIDCEHLLFIYSYVRSFLPCFFHDLAYFLFIVFFLQNSPESVVHQVPASTAATQVRVIMRDMTGKNVWDYTLLHGSLYMDNDHNHYIGKILQIF